MVRRAMVPGAAVLIAVCCATAGIGTAARAEAPAPGAAEKELEAELGIDLAESLRRAAPAYEQAQSALQTPAARAARHSSRTQFGRLGDAAALELAKATNRGLYSSPAFKALRLPAGTGARVKEYVGRRAAIVEDAAGNTSIFESLVPLRARTDDGLMAPVDLELEREAGGFSPHNPLIDTFFADTLDRPFTFETASGTVSVSPVGVPPVAAAKAGETIFYPSVAADTDLAVRAVPGGFQTFHQLRSIDAPETHSFDYAAPGGTELRLTAQGAELVDGDDVLAKITRPIAWDADGKPVAATYAVDGHRLTMHVDHQGADVRYPLTLDPINLGDGYWWHNAGEPSTAGWYVANWSTTGGYGAFFVPGWGLRLHGSHYNHFYNPHDRIGWDYRPGSQMRITWMRFHDVGVQSPGGMCAFAGMWGPTTGYQAGPWFACHQYNQPIMETHVGGTVGNLAFFGLGLINFEGGWRPPYTEAWLNNAEFSVTDDVAPTITGSVCEPGQTCGTNLNPDFVYRYDGYDHGGSGVHRIRISSPDDPTWVGYDNMWQCAGTPRWRCPGQATGHFRLRGLKPGSGRWVWVEVWDRTYGYTRRVERINYYPSSYTYGGANGTLDSPEEVAAARTALNSATADGRRQIWAGLNSHNKATMVADAREGDGGWISTIDTVGPSAAAHLDIVEETADTIAFAWEPGEDPDLEAAVPGSGTDRAQYRINRNGTWSSWRDTDDSGASVLDSGGFALEVREYDVAGNVGPTVSMTWPYADSADAPTTYDGDEVTAYAACGPPCAVAIVVCKKYCDDAAKEGWKRVRRIGARSKVPITRARTQNPAAAWRAARGVSDSTSRARLRGDLRAKSGDPVLGNSGTGWGKEAHHVVPLNGWKSGRAMEILIDCGIQPNEALNGVFLSKALHRRTRGDAYRETVNALLDVAYRHSGCNGAYGVRDTMLHIRRRLVAGTLPG